MKWANLTKEPEGGGAEEKLAKKCGLGLVLSASGDIEERRKVSGTSVSGEKKLKTFSHGISLAESAASEFRKEVTDSSGRFRAPK